jgi:Mycothiol maleylpyruvate isomerase N-terminal domain
MVDDLLAALDGARADFLDALADVDADLVTTPGVMDDWSVRDLVAHLAAWCEHASEALELAASGRGAEFAYSTDDTDAMNEVFLAAGRLTSPTDALRREESAFAAFRDRVASLDPTLLPLKLGNGGTVDEVIRYDGPDHYAEHTANIRGWFGAEADAE